MYKRLILFILCFLIGCNEKKTNTKNDIELFSLIGQENVNHQISKISNTYEKMSTGYDEIVMQGFMDSFENIEFRNELTKEMESAFKICNSHEQLLSNLMKNKKMKNFLIQKIQGMEEISDKLGNLAIEIGEFDLLSKTEPVGVNGLWIDEKNVPNSITGYLKNNKRIRLDGHNPPKDRSVIVLKFGERTTVNTDGEYQLSSDYLSIDQMSGSNSEPTKQPGTLWFTGFDVTNDNALEWEYYYDLEIRIQGNGCVRSYYATQTFVQMTVKRGSGYQNITDIQLLNEDWIQPVRTPEYECHNDIFLTGSGFQQNYYNIQLVEDDNWTNSLTKTPWIWKGALIGSNHSEDWYLDQIGEYSDLGGSYTAKRDDDIITAKKVNNSDLLLPTEEDPFTFRNGGYWYFYIQK